MKHPDTRKDEYRYLKAVIAGKNTRYRIAAISAAAFVLLTIISSMVFSAAMQNFNRIDAEAKLENILNTMELGLAKTVNSELALALKMADTTAIKSYFKNPGDKHLEAAAIEELSLFKEHFENKMVFWINDSDKIFHSTDAESYTVDPDLPENYWYNQTLYETQGYNLNINWNPDIKSINFWVNIPVYDENNKPVGILGTGIDLIEFTNMMTQLASVNAKIATYMFNRVGEITEAKDYELAIEKIHINDRLGIDAVAETKNVTDNGIYIFSRGNTLYGLKAIQELDWYAVAHMETSSFWASDLLINYLFIALFAIILIVILIFNLFVARYTNYLNVQTQSLIESQKKEFAAISGAEAAKKEKEGFIGKVSRDIRKSANEILGILKLISLRGGISTDTQRLIMEASSAGTSLLRAYSVGDIDEISDVSEHHLYNRHISSKHVKKAIGGIHHFFVINPKSFVTIDLLKNFLLSIEKCFSVGHRAEYKIYISRYPRDASAAVHRYISNVPEDETVRVYAVGGDGIAFDCINGLAKFKNAEIATIPYGNSNDICRSFGEEHFPEFRNIKLMSRAPSQPMDAIQCGRLYAAANCSIGIEGIAVSRFSAIINYLNDKKWRKFVPLIYNLGAVTSFLDSSCKPPEYRITMDGKQVAGKFTAINVGNIALNGGRNTPNPLAVPNDGVMDVIVSKDFTALQGLRAISDYTKGLYAKHPKDFTYYRCKEFTCESDVQMTVILDGEVFYTNRISLKMNPGALKIVSPGGIGFKDYSGQGVQSL